MHRRRFLQSAALSAAVPAAPQPAESDREYWLRILSKLSDPVLRNLAAGTLKLHMPVESLGNVADRKRYTHLEAFARLLAGIAPWLEATLPPGAERDRQQQYAALARQAMRSAVDPQSPDHLNFHDGGQPVVDCGFLSQALLRAPGELWKKLEPQTQGQLRDALLSSRAIQPGFNNWLLFSATVEAALAMMGGEWDSMRVDYALREHQQWYVGDGLYGDGPQFHFDYYNSFVIQPMLVDVLSALNRRNRAWAGITSDVMARARRYAAIQERLIAPDGSFPAVGRSIAYRCGAFHLLAQMALRRELPAPLTPGWVRSALTAVIRRTLEAPGTFDANGWLTVGLCGNQPHLGEGYISTGSLYLCATALLPLGLAPSDPFWAAPSEAWTSKRLWSGQDAPADHAL